MKAFLEILLAFCAVAAVTWLAWHKTGPDIAILEAAQSRPFAVYESGDFCVFVAGVAPVGSIAISAVPRHTYASNRQPLRCQ